jgi:hypothetical protein
MGNCPRNHIRAVVTAHGSLTEAVAEASRLMSAHGQGAYAVHLDCRGPLRRIRVADDLG